LNAAGEGASTASLGSLCQCLTNPTVKNFSLISNLNLPSSSLEPLPLVLSLHALVKSPSPAFLQALFRYGKAAMNLCWHAFHSESPLLKLLRLISVFGT